MQLQKLGVTPRKLGFVYVTMAALLLFLALSAWLRAAAWPVLALLLPLSLLLLEVGDDNGVRNLEAQVRTKKTAVDAAKQARDAAKQERESKYEELQKLLKFRTMADAVGRGMQLEKERDAIAVALQFVYLDADGSGEISWSEYEAWARQEWSKLRPALPDGSWGTKPAEAGGEVTELKLDKQELQVRTMLLLLPVLVVPVLLLLVLLLVLVVLLLPLLLVLTPLLSSSRPLRSCVRRS